VNHGRGRETQVRRSWWQGWRIPTFDLFISQLRRTFFYRAVVPTVVVVVDVVAAAATVVLLFAVAVQL
jgi:hypothetical protein